MISVTFSAETPVELRNQVQEFAVFHLNLKINDVGDSNSLLANNPAPKVNAPHVKGEKSKAIDEVGEQLELPIVPMRQGRKRTGRPVNSTNNNLKADEVQAPPPTVIASLGLGDQTNELHPAVIPMPIQDEEPPVPKKPEVHVPTLIEKPTLEEVKDMTRKLHAVKGMAPAIDTLGLFGVKRASDLPEDQWAAYIQACEKRLV